jgi:hypothetical protein
MMYLVFAHDMGDTEFVNAYTSRQDAESAIQRLQREFSENPHWYGSSPYYYEIIKGFKEADPVPCDCWDAAY